MLKQTFFAFIFFYILSSHLLYSQVGIGTKTPNSYSMLDIESIDKGILIPRMTDAQKLSILIPVNGLLIYQIDKEVGFYFYDGSIWLRLVKNISPNFTGTITSGSISAAGTISATAFVGDGSGLTGITTTIGDNTITTSKILDGTILNADIATGASISQGKIAGLTDALSNKVDIAAGERLIYASEITLLSNQSGANTGDQDISGIASNTTSINTNQGLIAANTASITTNQGVIASNTLSITDNIKDIALKANKANPTFTGTITSGSISSTGTISATAFVGDGSGLTNLPSSGGGLQRITEGSNSGYRRSDATAEVYGDIGQFAVDLSISDGTSSTGASGTASIAMGYNTSATSTITTAFGNSTKAIGDSSTAMGISTKASGYASTAMGYSTTAIGTNSTAMGTLTTASGDSSTAMGTSNTASGDNSTSMGYATRASGNNSTAMGESTEASGDNSTSMGYATRASGNNSTAMGESTANGYNSTAMGDRTIANGDNSTTMGVWATASDYGSLVIGRYNNAGSSISSDGNATSFTLSNTAFVIGNGAGVSIRSDAFKVMYNGDVTAAGTISATSFFGDGSGLTGISFNTLSITTNINDIAANTASITTNQGAIAANTASITSNINDIALKANRANPTFTGTINSGAMISAGTISATAFVGDGSGLTGISFNTLSITTNINDIAANTASITTNQGAIAANTVSITSNINDIALKANRANPTFTGTINSGVIISTGSISATAFVGDGSGLTGLSSGVGLQSITESSKTGYRRSDAIAANYGDIGLNAVDLSFSDISSSSNGATGTNANAIGYLTTASGDTSIAMGNNTVASETGAIAIGSSLIANTISEMVIGVFNQPSVSSNSTWSGTDPLFTIGNGSDPSEEEGGRNNAFQVLKNGNTIINGDANINGTKITKYGGVESTSFEGDGSKLTGISFNTVSITTNINDIAANTASITSNINDIVLKANKANPTFTGTISATAFVGDGSGLTGVVGSFNTSIAGVTSNVNGTIASDDFVFGSSQLSDIANNSDDDSRFLFEKARGAFRAGTNTTNSWDNSRKGINSVAMGYNTTAGGEGAVAIGTASDKSGFGAETLGPDASGKGAIAMGLSTSASEEGAYAFGTESQANGLNSIAGGLLSISTGAESIALGNTAKAIGANSVALGQNATANAPGSIVVGSNLTANSYSEMVVGYYNRPETLVTEHWVPNIPIFTVGNGTGSAFNNAFQILNNGNTTAAGTISATAFVGDGSGLTGLPSGGGLQSITEGANTGYRRSDANAANYGNIGAGAIDLSFSIAPSTTTGAIHNYAFATGFITTAKGEYSTAMGYDTEASGDYSTAMGRETKAFGYYSTAMGTSTIANGHASTAMGEATIANGYASTAMGEVTKASDYGSLAIGSYNSAGSSVSTDGSATAFDLDNTAFVIGNGTGDESRGDAFKVMFNGDVTAAGTISATAFVGDGSRLTGVTTDAVFLPTVVIGTQQWMEKNLDVMTYRNGDVIPQVTDNRAWSQLTTGAWCWYDNNAESGAIWGKLYNWAAVNDPRGLAPQGWHIPTDAEWTILSNKLGNETVAGGKMKTTGTTIWTTPNTSATNESGFAGLPGGIRHNSEGFKVVGNNGYWWSSSKNGGSNGWVRRLDYNNDDLKRTGMYQRYGFSVRCIRD